MRFQGPGANRSGVADSFSSVTEQAQTVFVLAPGP
jgi:hypothetical protein